MKKDNVEIQTTNQEICDCKIIEAVSNRVHLTCSRIFPKPARSSWYEDNFVGLSEDTN